MIRRRMFLYLLALGMFFSVSSCSVIKTFQNIARLKFKLDSINGLQLSGIPVSGKTSLKDFSATDLLRITSAVASKQLPVSFVLNVDALNPNDGKGGNPQTDVQLAKFPWKLLIDDKETITGDITSPISVPGVGQDVKFPLKIEMDLFKFFNNQDYQGLVNLVLKLSGQQSNPVSVKLVARPTVSSPIGNITYPGDLTIVSQEYR
ncbi:MAG: hypothetical protein ACM3UR_07130 [Bacteroidota bacterium]|nr:hypothetical protein [Ignavibacteria bacterium]MCU7500179.1 hypothetical protein [Ignavibacteria bacterium]MCU7513688.1 hypothetical protein [Ignavibacteria bacterium]MCU7522232.1 hypothetical protein [Ignavibacteria bacterium]MCU7524986.1 hypothetical protein [Ignavibacteria bacterium]